MALQAAPARQSPSLRHGQIQRLTCVSQRLKPHWASDWHCSTPVEGGVAAGAEADGLGELGSLGIALGVDGAGGFGFTTGELFTGFGERRGFTGLSVSSSLSVGVGESCAGSCGADGKGGGGSSSGNKKGRPNTTSAPANNTTIVANA